MKTLPVLSLLLALLAPPALAEEAPLLAAKVSSGALPAGLALSIVGNTLVLSGTPTTAATATFTASIGSTDSQTATSPQSVVVSAAYTILDLLSTSPSAAYSLRKLRAAYTGPAIKVEKASAGIFQDIGFDSGGNLDTAALTAFLGASDGNIVTWYDQSGSGLDVTAPATTSARPQIALAGVVQTLNGVPALNFNGSSHLDNAGGALASAAGWTANAVAEPSTYASSQPQSVIDQDNYPTAGQRVAQYLRFNTTNIEAISFNTAVTPFAATAPSSPTVITGICTPTSLTSFSNGTGGAPVTVTGTLQTGAFKFSLGRSLVNGGSSVLTGKYCEAIVFPAPISTADRHTLERNQGTYFGMSVA